MPPSALLEAATAAATLTLLDLAWINLAAPALGFDYLATVRAIQGGAPPAGRPIGLAAYVVMAAAAWRGARTGMERAGDDTPAAAAAGAAEIGAYVYGVYDLTNCFLFNGWSVGLAALDIAWGTTAFALAGAAVGAVRGWWARRRG